MTEDVAQGAGEAEAHRAVDLHLLDAGDTVLHRILDGEDLDPPLDQGEQHGVERRRLPAAGGSGDEQQPMAAGEQSLEPAHLLGTKPDLVETAHACRSVEDANRQALSVNGRQQG